MLKCQKEKLWLEYIPNLICDFSLIPLQGMTLAEQMNALTRLVLIVYLVLFLFGVNHTIIFLLLSLLFIIILFYIQRKNMETFKTEYYTPGISAMKLEKNPQTGRQQIVYNDPSSKRFCNDERPLDGPDGAFNNPNWVSVNQRLAGPPNPKTKIAPVVVPPIADLSYWKANNMVTHSAINENTNVDVYQSGYQVSTCCAPSFGCDTFPKLAVPVPNPFQYNAPLNETYTNYGKQEEHKQIIENYDIPYFKTNSGQEPIYIRPNGSGQVNVDCGYNPEQLYTAGLPTNLPVGNCMQSPMMKQFNENLFTQTIQPGVYTRNEINEPINANMGISFTQQFPPTTCKTNPLSGEVMYTEHDPRIIEPAITEPNLGVESAVTESNIYDPRFSGYGTSYRSYNDEVTGQPRFYYDDVDAIRMPNYIVRSNIDHQPFADQYGPIPQGNEYGNKFNPTMRSFANDAFLKGTIQQRTELQERLMRKGNANAWQNRMAPKHVGGQRMSGGMSCK